MPGLGGVTANHSQARNPSLIGQRAAIEVRSLPFNFPVEIEAAVEIQT